jgi:hypothetical protein
MQSRDLNYIHQYEQWFSVIYLITFIWYPNFAKQESAYQMSCYIVPYVTTRSMVYPQPVSLPTTVTHEGAANGGVVLY